MRTMMAGHGQVYKRTPLNVAVLIFRYFLASNSYDSTQFSWLLGTMESKKRKRELEDHVPRITYYAPDRTFERLFKGTHPHTIQTGLSRSSISTDQRMRDIDLQRNPSRRPSKLSGRN